MDRRHVLASTLLLALTLLPARAQDTCRIFSIPNPHGLAMTISQVFIADTVNFTVEPLRPVPFDIGASESWDARVCIKARDGQRHSTSIRYMTTHGQATFQLSMDAPATSGIFGDAAPAGALTAITAWPVPSTGTVTLQLDDALAGRVSVKIVDAGGVATTIEPSSRAGGVLRLDLGSFPSGAYVAVLAVDGRAVGRASIVLAR